MFKNSRDFLAIILGNFIARPIWLLLAGAMLLISAVTLTILPILASGVIEQWTSKKSVTLTPFDPSLIGLLAVFISWLISSSINSFIQEESNQRTVLRAQLELCRRWLQKAPSADEASYGIVTRITSDAQTFEKALAAITHHAPLAILQLVGALACMMLVAPILGLVFVLCLIAIAGGLSLAESRLVAMSHRVIKATEATMSSSIEVLTHNRLIRRFSQEEAECDRIQESQKILLNLLNKRRISQIIARALIFVALALSIGLITLIGIARINSGNAILGDLVAFVGLALIVGTSVTSLTDSLAAIAAGVEPLRRLTEQFESPSLPKRRVELLPNQSPTLRIAGLQFSYSSNDEDFLLHIDHLEIRPGTTVAFVGASGCGKSTLLRLIAGEEIAPKGCLYLDGYDLNELDRATLRTKVAYFDPAAPILARSVRDNISFGRNKSQSAFDDAVTTALAEDLLTKGGDGREFPRGLSSGQRQRIALARSLMTQAPLLLLDEATSAIDSRQERDIIESISKHYPGTTTIIVSHRLSAIRHADQIFVFSGGHIVESGTHEQLLRNRSAYTALFFDQLSSDRQ
ncbi:hypothetical protein BRX37_03455 [Sphingomonas sp. S-NIH.Pt3_0716]|nr:hypothetical protein BRX37_03455 [Sphingomonas sp. S-NIH.Pt3_0716]